MHNGTMNGSPAAAPHSVNVNPQQAATYALQFLPRVPHTHQEREAYDVAVMFLQAIANGQVQLQAVQQAPALPPAMPAQDS